MEKGRSKNKIFNIGFHKTGTSSLTVFMQNLGFRCLHNVAFAMKDLDLGNQSTGEEGDGMIVDLRGRIDQARLQNLIGRYDFFSDNPWPVLFRRLDRCYPGSLFILTRRDSESWLKSIIKHFGSQNTQMRQWIYGYGNPAGHPERYRGVYETHNKEVIRHFGSRDDLLVVDIEDDNDVIARRLLEFLGIRDVRIEFPTAPPIISS